MCVNCESWSKSLQVIVINLTKWYKSNLKVKTYIACILYLSVIGDSGLSTGDYSPPPPGAKFCTQYCI